MTRRDAPQSAADIFGLDPFRPRDDDDWDVHPDTLRGKALALMDLEAAITATIEKAVAAMPWYRR